MPFSPLAMSSGAAGSGAFGGGLGSNGTRSEKVEHLPPPFSSTSALTLLGVVIVAIVALSLTTHRCHKGRMRRRKMERAQEEYERDHRSPVPARAQPGVGRCAIVRPASRDAWNRPPSPDKPRASPDAPSTTSHTETGGREGADPEAAAVS